MPSLLRTLLLVVSLCLQTPAWAGDVLEKAASVGGFTTFLAVVEASGLAEQLKGPGPFTVFAPTDEAFARLPANRLDAILKDRAQAARLVGSHVLDVRIFSRDVHRALLGNLEGGMLRVANTGETIHVENARVLRADVVASNGVIHSIDAVLVAR